MALLPQDLYDLAIEITEKYEDGDLAPPADSAQRQRKRITSSSFDFLRGLDPTKEKDQVTIRTYLTDWDETAIQPLRNKKVI